MNNLTLRPRVRSVALPAISIPAAKRIRPFSVFIIPCKLLASLSLGLCVLLTLISMALIVYLRLVPSIHDEGIPAGLTRCVDTPCFHDLIPGRTSWADALAAVGGRAVLIGDLAYSRLTLFPSRQNGRLAGILLNGPFDPPVTIGALMTVYGAPSCVKIYVGSGGLFLHFGSLHVLARFTDHHFSPMTHVLSILLGSPFDEFKQDMYRCDPTPSGKNISFTSGYRWQGFATMEGYRNR